uniref:C2H2-type domain-containing protein n=1 Tax=Panagrolaimus superbus TaxID=310955 RepID=A0A914Y895_9BILA
MYSNLYASPHQLSTSNTYLPSSISPDFSNILLKPSILPDLNLLYPATTSAAPIPSYFPFSFYDCATKFTNEIFEAEQRRKLTQLEQQLVTQLLQASISQKQQIFLSRPTMPMPTISATTTTTTKPISLSNVITKKAHPRPHACNECGKRFRFHSNLVEHKTVHFDGSEHYYSCPFCPKKCRLKGNLKKHLHRHFKTQFEVDEAWHQLYGGRSKHPSESSSSSSSSSSSTSSSSITSSLSATLKI